MYVVCSSWMTVTSWSLNTSASCGVSLTLKICLSTFQESIFNTTRFLRLSRKTSPKSALSFSKKSPKTLRIIKSSLNSSERTLNSVSTKTQATVPSSLSSSAITPLRVVRKWLASRIMSPAWKKTKKTSISSLDSLRPLLPLHLSSRLSERRAIKFFTWLTLSMNMSFSNSRNSMVKSWRTALNKD